MEDNWTEKNIFFGKRPYIIIIVLGFALYFQALFFDFSYLDDNTLILDSKAFLGNLGNIPLAFQSDVFHLFNHSAAYYRPLMTISLMFDYQFGGITPFMYHFTNIILHIVTACLVFVFLKKLDYKKELAFLFSIIFLVHPALTQAVAWIPGRNDSLLAVFVLTTFIFFLDYLNESKRKQLTGSLIFFMLALFTKESALMILPIVIFYFYFIANKDKKINSKKIIFFIIWAMAIIVFWFFLRHLALSNGQIAMTFSDMVKSVWLNLPAVVQFLGKIFFPFNLTVLPIIQDTTFIYGIAAIILTASLIFFTKTKRWNFILFGSGWFLAFLLPSFIRPNPALIADFIEHRLYVPIIGFFIILLETDVIKKINFKKITHLITIGSVIFILCIITSFHRQNFVDRLTFWKDAAKDSPHYPLAHRNLGAMLFLDGKLDEALPEFEKALELNPNEEMAHNNIGLVYAEENKFSEAENEYKKELVINPYYDNAFFNLGLLYYKEQKYAEAEDQWKKTLEINPNYSDALYALASLYYDQKNYTESAIYAGELYKRGFMLPPELLQLLKYPKTTGILNTAGN